MKGKGATLDKLRVGLILFKQRHYEKKWTCALTPRLVEGILERLNCAWVESQQDYEQCIDEVDAFISMEPGWAAPILEFTRTRALRIKLAEKPAFIFMSDPHYGKWRQKYFLKNRFDYILAFYYFPTLFHFRKIPAERLIHFPWSLPDEWIFRGDITYSGETRIACFGAGNHEAYSIRNWCRTFPFVEGTYNSGVENKVMTDEEYIDWLRNKDAVIAAGSDDPKYMLTTPKYFEIAASGALLFAQYTEDLERLGFQHMVNCVIFNRDNFVELSEEYLGNPESYLQIRKAGVDLIRQRHSLSQRLSFLEELIVETRNRKMKR